MALKLRVISDQYKALGKRSSQLFGVTGGRIGRAHDNDWVLPDSDRYVSSHHAKVSFHTGHWMLEDTSTNGVFVNGADTPISVRGAYSLQDGDRLRLGDYEILVSIDERNDFPADASGQLPAPPRLLTKVALSEDLGEELDITDLLGDGAVNDTPASITSDPFPLDEPGRDATRRHDPPAKPATGDLKSLLDSLGPQRTAANPVDDWQMQTRPYDRRTLASLTPAMLVSGSHATRPATALNGTEPAKRSAPLGGDTASGIEAFCRGAGIDPNSLPNDTQAALLTLVGQIVRETVLGLMETLKGRADLKTQLRLSQTGIQPGENNPLKFSASVDEAVQKLLDPHGNRYLGPIEAIRESFTDLRSHQAALVAAIQSGMNGFMNRIEPGELQDRFDRGLKRGPLLGAANKMKYWDLYTEFYQALNQRNDQGLPAVFAEELSRSYAEKTAQKKK